MNDCPDVPEDSGQIPPEEVIPPEVYHAHRPISYWLKKLLACNPFYLVSAALLLYGFYRVSIDPGFLNGESAQLGFNLTSLQFYEAMLVVTAIFLARRCIWYDSTLLVFLENGLALVPFILVSQAALINSSLVWVLCLGAGVITVARFAGLRRFIPELNFPRRQAAIGSIILGANLLLPAIYRTLHEHKFGAKPDFGAAYFTNEYVWLLLLPALCGLANFLPRLRATGDLPPQRGWLPLGWFSLWLAATSVHLYCLGYVYDFDLRRELLTPAIWVLLWTSSRKLPDFSSTPRPNLERALLVLPLLITFLAYGGLRSGAFLALTTLNGLLYGWIYLHHREQRLGLHLLLISLVALVAGLPEEWGRALSAGFSPAKALGASAAAYFLLWSLLSRTPKHGLFGTLVCSTVAIVANGEHPGTIHWAAQAGLAFLLIHSLRWQDAANPGAKEARFVAALVWAADAFVWMHQNGSGLAACSFATPVLALYLVARLISGRWAPPIVPIAAMIVMLSGPSDATAGKLQNAPPGLLAVLGSFLLFGLGTLAALTKHRWNARHTRPA